MELDASSASSPTGNGLGDDGDRSEPAALIELPEPTAFGHAYDCNASREKTAAQFVIRLYELASDPRAAGVVEWARDGLSFVLHRGRDVQSLLSKYFGHSNIKSLQRQLNMYRFERQGPPSHFQYAHVYFRRGRPALLPRIVRKNPRKERKAKAAGCGAPSHMSASDHGGGGGGRDRGTTAMPMDVVDSLGHYHADISALSLQVQGLKSSCLESTAQVARILGENASLRDELSRLTNSISAMSQCMVSALAALAPGAVALSPPAPAPVAAAPPAPASARLCVQIPERGTKRPRCDDPDSASALRVTKRPCVPDFATATAAAAAAPVAGFELAGFSFDDYDLATSPTNLERLLFGGLTPSACAAAFPPMAPRSACGSGSVFETLVPLSPLSLAPPIMDFLAMCASPSAAGMAAQ